MFKFLFILAFICLTTTSSVFALDPIAPKSERAFGFFKVETPQKTDTCELKLLSPLQNSYTNTCQVGTILTLPVGEYQLNVKVQDYHWSEKVHVYPTEFTSVAVLGYGSLLVTSPDANDTVRVFDKQGNPLHHFKANHVKSIPIGTYRVTVKSKRAQTSIDEVNIVANKTRELVVTYQ